MRVFIDTEFTNFIECKLISLGAVAEDCREFYAELNDFDREKCSDFVHSIVLPKLGREPAVIGTEAEVGAALQEWLAQLGDSVEVCVDYAGDWELFYYLIRDPNTLEIPPNITCRNIAPDITDLDIEQYWIRFGRNDHHALHDARANKYAFEQCLHKPEVVFFDVITNKS